MQTALLGAGEGGLASTWSCN